MLDFSELEARIRPLDEGAMRASRDRWNAVAKPVGSLGRLEELVTQIKKDFTIVMVTHNMQQAARVSDYTAFFLNGKLIEHDTTDVIFTKPHDKKTEDYITGRFG